jgi:Blastomyces yeast-phase-specific protein
MFTSVLALASLALAPLASALPMDTVIGNAIINNLCNTEVTLWTTGNAQQGPWHLDANGGQYSEQYGGNGMAIVLVSGHSDDRNGKYADVPKTSFGYSYVNGAIWYDLDGNAFPGSKLVLASDDATCQSIVFDNGVNPGGDWTKQCHGDTNVVLTLCA